jgi:copper chaperone NosL
MAPRDAARRAPGTFVPALLAAAVLLALLACAPDGPADVAWDRVACAHCRMLVSDPRFAAQLQLEDGEVLHFDDPGCLLRMRATLDRPARAAWFHDSAGEGWLAERDVAFVRGAATPMGYGFAAVRAGSVPSAQSAQEALAALEARR